ncbi:MAG: hypothetical protein OEM62_08005, partial [Acidobacteriota bacterium]|nr:hypothetical protein [Acidobacteriota bacterium]
GHTMMIALVHWPKDRYAVAANLLLPALAGAALFELWRWIVPHDNGRERQAGAGSRVIGAGLALVIFILMVEALFRTVGVDFDQNKRAAAAVPIFYRQPSRPTGSIFFHRAGPAVWKGPVLKDGPEVEIHYDAAGFRNSPELADWEVVVVGDGFVEAGYLPDDRLFTSELSRRSGLRVKNLGTGSTGLLTHIHYLETWGVAPSTRHAVLVFNEGNDLNDLRTETSRLRRFQETGRREVLRAPLPQSSLLRATYRSLERLRASPPIHESSLIPQSANADLVLPGADNPRRVRVFQRIPSREHLPYGMTELLDQGIGQWAQTARDLGLEPWLLYMPSKHRLLFPFIRYDQDVPEPIRNWRPTNLPDLVRTIAEDHGVGFLNPGPRLARASSQGKMVYNPIDVYLSAEGSRQVGRFLASRFAPKKADSATEANHDPP